MCTSIIQVCACLAAVLLSPQMHVSAPAHVAMRLLSSVGIQTEHPHMVVCWLLFGADRCTALTSGVHTAVDLHYGIFIILKLVASERAITAFAVSCCSCCPCGSSIHSTSALRFRTVRAIRWLPLVLNLCGSPAAQLLLLVARALFLNLAVAFWVF